MKAPILRQSITNVLLISKTQRQYVDADLIESMMSNVSAKLSAITKNEQCAGKSLPDSKNVVHRRNGVHRARSHSIIQTDTAAEMSVVETVQSLSTPACLNGRS
jgi:hypothetical protein